MVIVGRPVNGISLNGLEYLLDDKGEPMQFESEDKAKEYLVEQGMPTSFMDDLVFEEG